jgi:hypothetical protein
MTAGRSNRGAVWVMWLFLILIVLPIAAFGGWTWMTLHYSYSTGDRAGYIQKISKKGWFCKTWEGELAMANLPGTMPQIFNFSVRDEAIAKKLSDTIGQRISLTYEQHRGIPTSCFGETEYFVTDVHTAEALPAPAPPSAPMTGSVNLSTPTPVR